MCLRFQTFDEPIDGFIYASFIALGASLTVLLIWGWRIHIIRRLHEIHLKTPANQK